MEYIREMLLRQRTALGRLMLGGGSAEEPHFGGGDAAAGPGPEACRMAVYGRLRTGWHRRDRRFCREAESHDGGWRSV